MTDAYLIINIAIISVVEPCHTVPKWEPFRHRHLEFHSSLAGGTDALPTKPSQHSETYWKNLFPNLQPSFSKGFGTCDTVLTIKNFV